MLKNFCSFTETSNVIWKLVIRYYLIDDYNKYNLKFKCDTMLNVEEKDPKNVFGSLRIYLCFNFNINTGSDWQNFQFVNCIRSWVKNVEHSDIGTSFKLLS